MNRLTLRGRCEPAAAFFERPACDLQHRLALSLFYEAGQIVRGLGKKYNGGRGFHRTRTIPLSSVGRSVVGWVERKRNPPRRSWWARAHPTGYVVVASRSSSWRRVGEAQAEPTAL